MTLVRLKLRMYLAVLVSAIVFFLFVWGITYLLQSYLPSAQIVSISHVPLIGLVPIIGPVLDAALVIFINAVMGPLLIPFILTIIFVLIQYLIGPSVVGRAMRLRYLKPGEKPWLEKTVQELAEEGHVPTPKIAICPMKEPNAFTYGRTSKGATLAVTDGLLNTLNEQEVRGVIGHELGHIKHKDYITLTVLSVLPLLAFLVARVAFTSAYFSGGSSGGRRGSSQNAGTLLVIAGILSLLVYLIFMMIVRAVSRTREFYADAYSARTTEDPKSLQSSLVKISTKLSQSVGESPGLRAFFIADPVSAQKDVERLRERGLLTDRDISRAIETGRKKDSFLSLNTLFSTHPPVYKRLVNLAKIDKDMRRTRPK
nr:zinc metalloprotease HtpX [Candidatus Njordarchaeum guaymaensis]